jgi:glucose/arabinose dehydrogenase
MRPVARHWLLLACGLALALVPPGSAARAQTCGLTSRVPFAGHAFPLESVPVPQPMTAVEAFPALPTFTRPVFVGAAPDGSNRLFVLEQAGRILVFPNDPNVSGAELSVFLDIRDPAGEVNDSGNEMGLLGLAFDPDFATNGFFYVNYTASVANCAAGAGLCTKIVRFTVPVATPNDADEASAFPILQFAQPASNHNGGMLAFGSDGLLWIATGDGGFGGDPDENAQNVNVPLGKLLRIDVDGDDFPTDAQRNYRIPPGNPYAGGGGLGEIWAYGLRNPWRFSFDRVTADLYVGDVGQNAWEEIDFVPAAAVAAPPTGGIDFGWDVCEGTHDFEGNCATDPSWKPVIEYPHDPNQPNHGFSVTGGYVYRGDALPALYGAYLYADHVTARVWAWNGVVPAAPTQIATLSAVSSFGEDQSGELYLVRLTPGDIFRLQPTAPPAAQFPTQLSQTGLFSDIVNLVPAPGMIEYDVIAPQWSDGAEARHWIALPGTQTIGFRPTDAFDLPVGTVLVMQLDLPAVPRRVETRVLLRQTDRYAAFTYRWDSAQTDATLLTDAFSEEIPVGPSTTQTWNYPSPTACLGCHSAVEGRLLGVRTRQLHRAFDYPPADDQLHAWSCIGLFEPPLPDPAGFGAYVAPDDTGASAQRRARSYLAANCANCHQPGGPAPTMDLRYRSLLGGLDAIGVAPTEGTLGIPNALRIRAGVKEESVLWHRVQSTLAAERMPKGSLVPDALATAFLGAWIDTGLGVLDTDEDGFADEADNCARAQNDQLDTGGAFTSAPDGIGNACQCLDVDLDGTVEEAEATPLRDALAGLATLPAAAQRRCTHADVYGQCTLADAVRLARAALGLAPALAQTCAAALEPL